MNRLEPLRIIPFAGALNFRDLGGYPTSEGRFTRWGHLFRSDALQDLTHDDLGLFQSLGIATVVDLRSTHEIERTGRGRLATEPIRFVNASISSINGDHPTPSSDIGHKYLLRRYLQYIEDGCSEFVRAIQEMTVIENYPIVINCFLGKDRTGVLAALVLGCLGVDPESIVSDYWFTSTRMAFVTEKLKKDPVYRETVERTPPEVLGAAPETMSHFLSELDQRYGGARGWALSAGVAPHQLDALSDILLM